MKTPAIIGTLAATAAFATTGCAMDFQTDTFKTKGGKEVVVTAIKHASLRIQYDGLRIYIAGDTEDIPEMSALKDIDVAFLPSDQPYTMTPEQVAKAARTIKPKVLFPYHYSQTPIKQVADLLTGSGIDVRIRNYQ